MIDLSFLFKIRAFPKEILEVDFFHIFQNMDWESMGKSEKWMNYRIFETGFLDGRLVIA